MVYVGGNYDINVNTTIKANASAKITNDITGVFEPCIKITESNVDVTSVKIAVWSSDGWQDDVAWYSASKQSDGSYTCSVPVSKHKYDLGDYYIDAYAVFENGVQKYAAGCVYNVNLSNFLYVNKTSNGHRDVVIKNVSAGTTKVEFAIWSNTNGQDDLKWLTATKQSDGSYKLNLNLSEFKNSGTFTVHTYRNGTRTNDDFLRATTFTVDANELAKNGWYYENGYKFYYINGAKQTDVRGIIGAQSTYKIQVNRTCNTVTIYAKDGSNGYIIPVCAFACSVGLPQTPTYTGTYTVGAKYRWKMLMGPSWGQYATAVNGQSGVYFHSVAGSNTTSYNISAVEYNKLGSAASHGCIRLNVRDAKWIHDNVPSGCQIYIYDNSNPGPLGKPATIKIPASQNWDPTDPAI